MDNLEFIECVYCDFAIAADPIIAEYDDLTLQYLMTHTGADLIRHLIMDHSIRKYMAMKKVPLKQKVILFKLFKEFDKTLKGD